jgi:DNA-binding response OmpR family regulator
MSTSLASVTILVVEDDPIIALDIQHTLASAGATVIGPAHSVAAAAALLDQTPIDAAVLDHLIVGGDSLLLAEELCRRNVKFLFHTSHRGMLPQRFPDAPVIDKPSRPGELVAALQALLKGPFRDR